MITWAIQRDAESHPLPSKAELMEMMETVKAVIYARVSTQDQARHGYSLTSQVERSLAHLQSKYGIGEDQVIAVVEHGEMGDDPNRPALHRALWLIEQGIASKFVVLHPDRLARDLRLQLSITERIWNAGCDIAFVEMDVDPNNPESLLLYNIQGAIAQYNKAKILANSRRGRRTKVMNGKIPGIRRIYGYDFDKTQDILVVNERERDVYLMMVDWILHGKDGQRMNLTAVARELSVLGIPAPSGDKWYQATVSRILKNPVYTGTFYYGKTEYQQKAGRTEIVRKPPDEWQAVTVPAYIDENTYRALQTRIQSFARRGRGAPPKSSYLLKGLVRCGRCGAAVVAGAPSRDKRTNEPRYHYYVCSGKSRKIFEVGSGRPVYVCRGRNWRQDVVDDYVWRYLSRQLVRRRQVLLQLWTAQRDGGRIDALVASRKRVERAMKARQTERKRWLQLAAKGRIDERELAQAVDPLECTLHDLHAKLAEIDGELATFERAREAASRDTELLDCFSDYLEQRIDDADKKRLADLLIDHVVLYDDAIELYLNWSESTDTCGDGSNNCNTGQGDGGL
ncbi:recombinase family protein [Alicyclobacillus suci]|uniref:recombinase family protein n=1 Tax=Alicyclobacillus suci TaxID=2816080 RepID=UPI001F22C7C3|nr:recombinase family protein [Alicyclobacillus suci]